MDGEIEVIEYKNNDNVRIKFVATGNSYTVQKINISNGQIQDRDERRRLSALRQEAEQRLKDEKIDAAKEKVRRQEEELAAKEAEKQSKKLAATEAKRNRLVGHEYIDNLGMKFTVVSSVGGKKSWLIRYTDTGNTYTVKEGWMLRGGCFDRNRVDFQNRYEAYCKQKAIAHYEASREKYIAMASEYQRKNKERTNIRNANRRARRINAQGTHTYEEALELLNQQEFQCACCGESLEDVRHLDHIMPLALGGTNWIENLQWLCPFCNLSKSDRHPDEWRAYTATPEFASRREARRSLQ